MRGRTLGRDNARQDFQAIDEPRFNTDYQSQREGQGRCSIHLLVKDTGGDVIAPSMQLIAGRTAQEYNQRKNRHGAFWEDRYHATAIEADDHLHRCLAYIDLNMVRAGGRIE